MQSTFILTAKETTAIMAAALDKAQELQLALSIAITDAGGHLLAFHRMDGAGAMSAMVAPGKARSAALSKVPTAVLEERAKDRHVMMTLGDLVMVMGGLPIMVEGQCIGAIGVSGATSQLDEDVARAALGVL